MTKNITVLFSFILIFSCGKIDFVLKDNDLPNLLKNNIFVVVSGDEQERYDRELFSFFGSNKVHEYILETSLVEKKENRVVKKNQVAEKIDYQLIIDYDLFYKNRECKILEKKIITKFTTSSKSFGYNFGADRSFEKLYGSSIKKNITMFMNYLPKSTDCLK